MSTPTDTVGRSLAVRISLRLALAAVLLSMMEVAAVLIVYGSNRPKLATQLITLHADRIAAIVMAAPTQQTLRDRLSRIDRPTGAGAWSFSVHDRTQATIFEHRSDVLLPDAQWSGSYAFDWTRHESLGDDEVVQGGRRLTASNDIRITIGMRGNGLSMFAPVFVREAIDHVVLPVIPLAFVLLIVNVQIVRRMLAPLSAAAAQVDALNPARMDARLGVPTDTYEVRALVLAVNRALDRLQHAMTVLESFTADAAHEIRTPLSVLRLRIDSLAAGPIKERLLEELAIVTRLADQLLDLAQADVLEIHPDSTVSLSNLARDVAARMHPLSFARGCDICLIDHGGGSVTGHPEALARVVSNLIDNAVGHSTQGTTIDVVVGPGARLAVRDRGPGIPETSAPFMFKRFWRGPEQARDGAGLGLAIVHTILTKHGATITAGNADGGGAIFTIEWPAAAKSPMLSRSLPGHRPCRP